MLWDKWVLLTPTRHTCDKFHGIRWMTTFFQIKHTYLHSWRQTHSCTLYDDDNFWKINPKLILERDSADLKNDTKKWVRCVCAPSLVWQCWWWCACCFEVFSFRPASVFYHLHSVRRQIKYIDLFNLILIRRLCSCTFELIMNFIPSKTLNMFVDDFSTQLTSAQAHAKINLLFRTWKPTLLSRHQTTLSM